MVPAYSNTEGFYRPVPESYFVLVCLVWRLAAGLPCTVVVIPVTT